MPIASALSIEQMTSRSWIVSSSTFASDTLMSPATTTPLSRILSRMSTSPWGCRCSMGMCERMLIEGAHRAKRQIEVVVLEPEHLLHLDHLLLELHQRRAEPLDLFFGAVAGLHPPHSLLRQQAPY